MPLLTEEDWVTRFYHEVAPTALADTSAPDRLWISKSFSAAWPMELATPGQGPEDEINPARVASLALVTRTRMLQPLQGWI